MVEEKRQLDDSSTRQIITSREENDSPVRISLSHHSLEGTQLKADVETKTNAVPELSSDNSINIVQSRNIQPDALSPTSQSVQSDVAKHLNQEGLVGDGQNIHTISASELENLLRREAIVSKLEKDLYTSVIYIFVGLVIGFIILSF